MKYAPFVVVVIALAAGTLWEGKYSERWGAVTSERLQTFTERLNHIPMKVGDWQGIDEPETEEQQRQFAASHCTNFVSRTYTNRDGQRVNVYIVSGNNRHITIHTPDWCYVGAGYRMIDSPRQRRISNVPNMPADPEFLTTVFRKEEALFSHHIRIFWGFSDDGTWRGPKSPKLAYAGRPALYKIYMITDLDEVGNDIEKNPTLEFAREFLPVINPILFDGTKDAPKAKDGGATES